MINVDDFRSMIVQLAGKIEEDELPMLKVALSDIIRNAGELQKASEIEIFTLLETGGHISPTNVSLLIELFQVTSMNMLIDTIICNYYANCLNMAIPQNISDYRRMLIDLGKNLESQDVVAVAKLCGVTKKESKDNWALITTLTRQMKLDDDIQKMETFANLLRDQESLRHIYKIVNEFGVKMETNN